MNTNLSSESLLALATPPTMPSTSIPASAYAKDYTPDNKSLETFEAMKNVQERLLASLLMDGLDDLRTCISTSYMSTSQKMEALSRLNTANESNIIEISEDLYRSFIAEFLMEQKTELINKLTGAGSRLRPEDRVITLAKLEAVTLETVRGVYTQCGQLGITDPPGLEELKIQSLLVRHFKAESKAFVLASDQKRFYEKELVRLQELLNNTRIRIAYSEYLIDSGRSQDVELTPLQIEQAQRICTVLSKSIEQVTKKLAIANKEYTRLKAVREAVSVEMNLRPKVTMQLSKLNKQVAEQLQQSTTPRKSRLLSR